MAKKGIINLSVPNDEDWEAKDALHTILRAKEHMKNPALMKRVRAHAQSKLTQMASVVAGAPDGDADDSAPAVINPRKK